MRKNMHTALIVGALALTVPAAAASAGEIWAASYNVNTGASDGTTLWKFDTTGGTLTSVADFSGISYVNSVADTGSWIYMTAWTGSAYEVHKIDRSTYGVASVSSVSGITSGAADRFVGMVWDGTRLWGMHRTGETYALGLDAFGNIVSATPGIDVYGGLGSTSNGVIGALAQDATDGYVAGLRNSRYVYGASDLDSGSASLLSDYQGMDQLAGLAYDDTGDLFGAEFFLGPSNVDPNAALIVKIDPNVGNGFIASWDFTSQLASKGHLGFGGLERVAPGQVVPLPGAGVMGLGLLGVLGLGGLVRRRRQA